MIGPLYCYFPSSYKKRTQQNNLKYAFLKWRNRANKAPQEHVSHVLDLARASPLTQWGSPMPLTTRTKKRRHMERTIHLQAKLTEAQHAKLKTKAAKAGMGLAELVVAMIESREVVEAKADARPVIRELVSWFGRINSNLNMLSKHANIHRENAQGTLILHCLNDIRCDVLTLTQQAEKLHKRPGRPSND